MFFIMQWEYDMISNMERIYLDNSATSWPKTEECIKSVTEFLSLSCSNINRTYGDAAEKDEDRILSLRFRLAKLFGHDNVSTVILNSGITESINTVSQACSMKRITQSRPLWSTTRSSGA